MTKILTVLILFILSSVDLAFSLEKQQNSEVKKQGVSDIKPKATKENEDPDLKLSIEELKKKYPISLLDEKKKNYKEGQKINIDDYSEAEIKAAFLNVDKGSKNDKFESSTIKKVCERLGWTYNLPVMTESQKRTQFFIFSNYKIREYVSQLVSDDISFCLLDADPLGIENRD